MVRDDADTDFVCRTTVSVFVLSYQKFNEIKRKRKDLKETKLRLKDQLFKSYYPLALDYIFHNNVKNGIENYQETLRKNELRVKFKNAIMQHWTKVKEETQPGNLQNMIDDMLKRERASKGGDGQTIKDAQEEEENRKKKRERRKERAQRKEYDLEQQAKESYLNKEQF